MKLFTLLDTQYHRYKQSVQSYLSKTLTQSGKPYGNATVFGQLMNVVAATVQNIMLYIEDALVEQNKFTAQRKKSIWGLAALSGYNPSLGKATSVQLKVNFVPTTVQGLNVVLSNHQRLVCTQNGLTYNLVLPQEAIVMSVERDASTRYIQAVQGKFESQSFVSAGGHYYTINFRFTGNIDPDYMEVKVNNELWEYADSIYDMNADGKQWTYRTSYVNGVDLVFGNDVHGRALKQGDQVTVSYLTHDGEQGNLDVNAETYFVFEDAISDISGDQLDGNNIFNITFADHDPVSSGTNSESTEQVRQMIGLNSRGLVLADPANYRMFINRFSFCGYNRTWSEPGSLVVNSLIIKNYAQSLRKGDDYFNLREEDFYLTDLQKASIYSCIQNTGNQLAGVTYNIYNPELCKYAMYMYVKLKNATTDQEYITNQIRKLVGEFFSEVASDTFIPKSDITHLIKSNIEAVDGIDIYFLSERNETALQRGQYVEKTTKYDPSTGTFRTTANVIKLYNGENPNLGLDAHGNIYLQSDEQFPVLMGGWDFLNEQGQEVKVVDPLIITYN